MSYKKDYEFVAERNVRERVGVYEAPDDAKIMDPMERAIEKLKTAYRQCTNKEIPDDKLRIVKTLNMHLINLNMSLLALSICFHNIYNNINEANISQFLKEKVNKKEYHYFDIIRYIRFFNTLSEKSE